MTTLTEIQNFLAPKKMAFAGASRNLKKFGAVVFKELISKGFDLYPIHPSATEIQGIKCYNRMQDLPSGIDSLYIVTPKSHTAELLRQAAGTEITRIWIQQQSESNESLEIAAEQNLQVISGRCILMYAEPVKSVHGFHRWLTKTFRLYPKD
jgi:uncharacterized protein